MIFSIMWKVTKMLAFLASLPMLISNACLAGFGSKGWARFTSGASHIFGG